MRLISLTELKCFYCRFFSPFPFCWCGAHPLVHARSSSSQPALLVWVWDAVSFLAVPPFPLRASWPQWLSQLCSHEPAAIQQQQTERTTAEHTRSFYSKDSQQASLAASHLLLYVWENADDYCCRLKMFCFPKRWIMLAKVQISLGLGIGFHCG